jgi:hypothetical protein
MTAPSQPVLFAREHVLQLLSAGELAGVGTADTHTHLRRGDEYLDLEQLQRGVLRADGAVTNLSQVLSRKAINEDTWRRILRQLKAATP